MGTSLIESLRTAIEHVLDPILADTRRVALLDFPTHSNVGDSAIWLGTLAYLREKGKVVCYSCDHDTYSRDTLAERLGDGIILLSGGGNFGDIWKLPQRLRERVVRDFPDARIVQLPQTIMFHDERELERARVIFDAHHALTLLVRDRRSLGFAAENFRARALLCPDMALWLGPMARPSSPTKPVVWLARTDRERGAGSPPVGAKSVDWLHEPRTPRLDLESFLREIVVRHPRAERTLRSALSRVADRAAVARLRRGCATLSEGRVVITDRLHAHILSLLLGIPNVILDNSYGKIRDFHQTWTSNSELVTLAASPEHAMSLAAERAS
ncbi:MAG TPA: polysaccharide pyruvyl transferase family protein [Gemmatimonadaceae bacterium]|nr:polysaccharide pyruvyl transferase family protein [Gemmatimonadaceae bacterium]